ncbi:Uncharacterised protein [Mycobacterium tuberculosis]|nr:Uncharacterised protein [Mycobacterium tuberculosis]
MGHVGLRFHRSERDRDNLCVLRLPDQRRGSGSAGRHLTGELVGSCGGGRRVDHRGAGARRRRVGGVSAPPSGGTVCADRHRGRADLRNVPDPRRPPLPVGRAGFARGHRGVQRFVQRSVQRDAAPTVHTQHGGPDLRLRLGVGLCRQRRALAGDLSGFHVR